MNPDDSPKLSKETVYVDVEDEITSIIDKVDSSKSKLVALVLPKRAATLQSVVNMRLLKRSAERAGKNIVLITSESALLPLAGAVGLHVAKNLQSTPQIPPSPLEAQIEPPVASVKAVPVADADDLDVADEEPTPPAKIDYNRSIGELAAAHDVDEPDVIALDDEDDLPEPAEPKSSAAKKSKNSAAKVPNFDRFRLLLFGGIAAAILLIIFIILAIFVLPKATVNIVTSSEPVAANLSLSASDKYKTLNESANQIPDSLKASNQTTQETVNATGQQNQGNKASGSVILNAGACSSTVPSDIPAGTGVSSSGYTFITQSTVSFAPTVSKGKCTYQSGNTNVIAQKGGSNYNLPASSSFTVSGYPGVSGSNGAAFSGGTDNNVTVVSQSDVDSAKAKATSGSSSDDYANKFMQQLSNSGLYVLKSTLKVGDPTVTSTPAVGQPASTANVSIVVTYTVLTVQKSDLTMLIQDTLNQQIDKSKQKLSSANVLNGADVTVQSQPSDTTANLGVNEDTTAVPIININSVKTLAAGQKSGATQATISAWPGVKSVSVKLSPFWVSKAPKKPSKITVNLQQAKS